MRQLSFWRMAVMADKGEEDLREVTSRLLVLRLLLCEKASKRDDVCVDLLLRYRSSLAVCLGHGCCLWRKLGMSEFLRVV